MGVFLKIVQEKSPCLRTFVKTFGALTIHVREIKTIRFD